ncbi:MAG: AMP-dependent synthetase/ligase [Myxococcota bacterium]
MSTLAQLYVDKCTRSADQVAMHYREGDAWVSYRWRDCLRNVAAASESLRAMGVASGDRVAILGNPHPRWLTADFATLSLGGVSVGIYPTLRPEAVGYQLRHSGAKVLLVEDEAQLARLAGAVPEGVVARTWEIVGGAEPDMAAFRARVAEVKPEQPACIFYTSGTTGDPKGAVVTHAAMLATCLASREAIPVEPGDRSIAFLPLAHSLQRMTAYRALLEDITAWFCGSLDQFPATLQVARPQVVASVPRMLEKIKASAEAAVAKQSPLVQRIFAWGLAVGKERSRLLEEGKPVPPWLALRWRIADRLVYAKVRQRFGGALRLFACGGARLDPEVARFFHAMGIGVCEAWGLTETCAPATLNRPTDFRFGTVGKALPGTELKLDEDGEVLVRGPGLFSGYWQDPDATAAAFTPDGFFRTGDVGVLEDGFLRIVDRKKEILVTSGGKNIPPVNIEKKIEGGAIGQAVVIGNDRPYLVALLAPDPEVPCDDRAAYAAARLAAANATLAPFEQVKKWAWLPEPLTVESGMLTPTLKLKRRIIEERYRGVIEGMYGR